MSDDTATHHEIRLWLESPRRGQVDVEAEVDRAADARRELVERLPEGQVPAFVLGLRVDDRDRRFRDPEDSRGGTAEDRTDDEEGLIARLHVSESGQEPRALSLVWHGATSVC